MQKRSIHIRVFTDQFEALDRYCEQHDLTIQSLFDELVRPALKKSDIDYPRRFGRKPEPRQS